MILTDRVQEIWEGVRRHRLRTALTGLAVAWGIFMLVVLLGTGRGLQNSVDYNFRDDAINSIWLYPSQTTRPWKGHPPGRRIALSLRDQALLGEGVKEADHLASRYYLGGDFTVRYGRKVARYDVRATQPDHRFIEKTIVVRGRFLNDRDLEARRKVAVIGVDIVRQLFGDEDPLGKWILVGDIAWRVVGVYDDEGGEGELRKIYLPITTAQAVYGGGDTVHQTMFTLDPTVDSEASKEVARQAKALLARRHDFDPSDRRAIYVRNNLERYERIASVFRWIQYFVWLVGLGTIVAGVVGVSNIMLISVAERTREFGLRKALGATPGSIVRMVVAEALLITLSAGYLGLVAGVGVIELAGHTLPENDYVRNPSVELWMALAAAALLALAGTLAGYMPARRAARIDPVTALRDV